MSQSSNGSVALAGPGGDSSASPERVSRPRGRFFAVGVGPVARKEFADHLSGLRFGILLVLIAVTTLAAVYAASSAIREAVSDSSTAGFAFLNLFTVSGQSLPSFTSFITFLAPLLGIALGFDALNSERSQGTLSRLISQPIHRDAVLQGKFVAGLGVVGLALTALVVIVGGIGIVLLGTTPSLEEVGRLVAFVIVTVIYVAFWLALAQLFSVLFKQAATSALASIAVWLFFAIFASLIVGLVVNAVAPAGDNATDSELLRHAQLETTLDRVSPGTLYDEATSALLNPSVRSLGVLVYEQVDRAVVGPLSFGQSLLLCWPQIIALVGCVLLFFTVSYILFMREEIRA
jgi:ABC-2 type transport system permease protein